MQVVARSNLVYDFANNIAVLPPEARGESVVVSSMGQEENNPDVNPLLNGVPAFVAPSLIGAVRVPAE